MALVYNRNLTKNELLQLTGDISQIARVKPHTLRDGPESGVYALDVTNGSGLEFSIIADRGLDISSARYNGMSLAWRSACMDRNPAFFESDGFGWLQTFAGGLVTTCGLTWNGAPCEDEGKALGLHGRYSHLPATNVSYNGEWRGDDYFLEVSGIVRETSVFGDKLQLTRKITVKLGEKVIRIHDTVENIGSMISPHMILYHINFGFPIVDADTKLVAKGKSTPRDAEAEIDAEHYNLMHSPVQGYREKCYFIDLEEDESHHATASLINPKLGDGAGVFVRIDKRELPWFTEWKMLGYGEYVVGLEPGNCLVLGRKREREAGRLQHLKPGEIREYHLEIGVL
jgi:hypothetical protein